MSAPERQPAKSWVGTQAELVTRVRVDLRDLRPPLGAPHRRVVPGVPPPWATAPARVGGTTRLLCGVVGAWWRARRGYGLSLPPTPTGREVEAALGLLGGWRSAARPQLLAASGRYAALKRGAVDGTAGDQLRDQLGGQLGDQLWDQLGDQLDRRRELLKSPPIVNLSLLDQALEHIRRHPGQHTQDKWRCRTGMCLAGWICDLAGGSWVTGADEYGSDLLYADEDDDPDWVESWRSPMTSRVARVVTAYHRARQLLGLPSADPHLWALFGGTSSWDEQMRARDDLAASHPELDTP